MQKPNPERIDDENPEWSEADVAKAIPLGSIYLTFLTPMDCGFSLWATATDCGWEVKYIDPIPFSVLPAELQALLSEEKRVTPDAKATSKRQPAA